MHKTQTRGENLESERSQLHKWSKSIFALCFSSFVTNYLLIPRLPLSQLLAHVISFSTISHLPNLPLNLMIYAQKTKGMSCMLAQYFWSNSKAEF